jgi:hypothetical protein
MSFPNDLGNYRGKRKPAPRFNNGIPLTPAERRSALSLPSARHTLAVEPAGLLMAIAAAMFRRRVAAFVVAMVGLLALAGCASSTAVNPQAQRAQAHITYTTTLQGIDTGVNARTFSAKQERSILAWLPVADAALRAVDALSADGGPSYQAALNAFADALAQLPAATPKPTTQPTK